METPGIQEDSAIEASVSVVLTTPAASTDSEGSALNEFTPWLCVKPAYRQEFVNWFGVSYATIARSILSGLIVAMLLVPESIVFALVAHVPVPSGLWVCAMHHAVVCPCFARASCGLRVRGNHPLPLPDFRRRRCSWPRLAELWAAPPA